MTPATTITRHIGNTEYSVRNAQLVANYGDLYLYKHAAGREHPWPMPGVRRFFSVQIVGEQDEQQIVKPLTDAEAEALFDQLPIKHVDADDAFAGLIAKAPKQTGRFSVEGTSLYRTRGRAFFTTEGDESTPVSEEQARELWNRLYERRVPFEIAFG